MAIKICECPFQKLKNFRYCGSDVVESEICFVPGVTKAQIEAGDISFTDPVASNFKVELVCCNLIVVCGFVTKTLTYKEGSETKTISKDIPVQIEIHADINNEALFDPAKWEVLGAEVCSSGCTNLVCPKTKKVGTTPTDVVFYHKLIEKDIVSVSVKSL